MLRMEVARYRAKRMVVILLVPLWGHYEVFSMTIILRFLDILDFNYFRYLGIRIETLYT